MKALVYKRYGSENELQLREVEMPEPGPSDVRVRVRAVSLNGADAEFLCGSPLYARLAGIVRPRRSRRVLGSDVAGIVDAVGEAVTDLKPGDEVFGDIFEYFGGLAEQVCAPRQRWVKKPTALSFEHAAALPQAGVLAWQGVCLDGDIPEGGRALIIGAGGGVGSFAVQFAKRRGASVTAVDGPAKLDFLRQLGADTLLDYTREPYPPPGKTYDLILDTAGRRSIRALREGLAPAGRLLVVGGLERHVLGAAWRGLVASLAGSRQSLGLLLWDRDPQLVQGVAQCVVAGEIHPAIDVVLPLARAPEGFARMRRGEARGKVVIRLDDSAATSQIDRALTGEKFSSTMA